MDKWYYLIPIPLLLGVLLGLGQLSNTVVDCRRGESCQTAEIYHAPECITLDKPNSKKAELLKKIDIYTEEKKEFCYPDPVRAWKTKLITDNENYVTSPIDSTNYEAQLKDLDLKDPFSIEFSGDEMIITEKTGRITAHRSGSQIKEGNLSVIDVGTAGLMGLAPHPNYTSNNELFVYYSYKRAEGSESKLKNRLSRFKFTENGLQDEEVLLDNIRGSSYLSGGRVEISPEGRIYISTGSAGGGKATAQNLSSRAGKILRINLNGSIPESNPYKSAVFSYGHRNPQGLEFNPETEDLYSSEHGDQKHDEINLIEKGENYGWPVTECSSFRESEENNFTSTSPEKCFKSWTMAPSGITFVDDPGHRWHGDLFITGLRGRQIQRARLEGSSLTENKIFYFNQDLEGTPPIGFRDIEYHNGSLWVIGDSKGLIEISS